MRDCKKQTTKEEEDERKRGEEFVVRALKSYTLEKGFRELKGLANT